MELYNKGNELYVEENFQEAIESFKAAAEAITDVQAKMKSLVHLALSLLRYGEPASAIVELNKAQAMGEPTYFMYYVKGRIFYELHKYADAKTAFLSAYAVNPSKTFLMDWINRCETESKGVEGAKEEEGKKKTEKPEEKQPKAPAVEVTKEAQEQVEEEKDVENKEEAKEEEVKKEEKKAEEKIIVPEENPKPVKRTIKRDWYQIGKHAFLTLYVKKQKEENLEVEFNPKNIKIALKDAFPEGGEYKDTIYLANEITPGGCTAKISTFKIEIKVEKKEATEWSAYEGESDVAEDNQLKYPSSAPKKVDFDLLNKETEKDDEGDGLTQLLKDIYMKADEKTRRAMNKSFVESDGTVLSTNWSEVGKGTVECKPPDGMERRSYEK